MRAHHRFLLVLVLATGCGGPRTRPGPLHAGRSDGPPSMECLPDPDVEDSELTERMTFAMQLATESLSIEPPAPPASRAVLDLQEWSSGPLRAWLEQKTHALEAARRELDLAAEESHRQRIMGGAIVGLMYEDVARVLSDLPRPEDLDDEPEILEIYQQVLTSQARPYLETARRAYHACSANASEPDTMRHWARFCSDRRDGLPGGETLQSGETQVEVIADE